MQQISNANITLQFSRVEVFLQTFNRLGVLALEQVLLTILSPHQMCNGSHNLQEYCLFWFDFHSSFGTYGLLLQETSVAWMHSAKINKYSVWLALQHLFESQRLFYMEPHQLPSLCLYTSRHVDHNSVFIFHSRLLSMLVILLFWLFLCTGDVFSSHRPSIGGGGF